MRKVTLICIVCFSILAVSLAGLLLSSRGQQSAGTQAGSLAALHFAECAMPCWAGIVPGRTGVDDARSRLQVLFDQSKIAQTEVRSMTSRIEMQFWRFATPKQSVQVRVGASDGIIVDTIVFAFPDGQATIADVLRLLGTPTRTARWHQNFPYFVLAYGTDSAGVMVFSDLLSDRLQWSQPVRAIEVYGPGHLPVPADDLQPWVGFRSSAQLSRYFVREP